MERTNLEDQIIKHIEAQRFHPSPSSWDRLAAQLDQEQAKPKRTWTRWYGYAAAIALLCSVGYFQVQPSDVKPTSNHEVLANTAVDSLDQRPEASKSLASDTSQPIQKQLLSSIQLVSLQQQPRMLAVAFKPNIDRRAVLGYQIVAPTIPNRIKVDADALLYAVSQSPEKVKAYYAKYKVDRKKVLQHMQELIQKNNYTVDAEALLANVEMSIDEENFKSHFIQLTNKKLSGLAMAFVDRNR